jgi:hypothetical protein
MVFTFGGARERSLETLYDFLERRERELVNFTTALQSELDTAKNELADIRSAKRQFGNLGGADKKRLGMPTDPKAAVAILEERLNETTLRPLGNKSFEGSLAENLAALGAGLDGLTERIIGGTSTETIKELILKAMGASFRKDGATPAQLREFIRDAYGRDIDRNSLSPQISRLKEEHLIKQKPGEEVWRLTKEGITRLRAQSWYGIPLKTDDAESKP